MIIDVVVVVVVVMLVSLTTPTMFTIVAVVVIAVVAVVAVVSRNSISRDLADVITILPAAASIRGWLSTITGNTIAAVTYDLTPPSDLTYLSMRPAPMRRGR